MKGLNRVLVLVAISSCVVTIALLAPGAGASTTYIDGAWTITADTTLSDGTWWVNGTVFVTAATLSLDRAELVIDGNPGFKGLDLDSTSTLVAKDSIIRGAKVPLAIDLGGGGTLVNCTLSRLGDTTTGVGIQSTAGKLVLEHCTLSDGKKLLMSTSDLEVKQCLFEDFWGFGVEWWSEGSTSVLIEDTTFVCGSPSGRAIVLNGPVDVATGPTVQVQRCTFVNGSCSLTVYGFADAGALTIEDNVARGCAYGVHIYSAGAALTMRGNIWDIDDEAIAVQLNIDGERMPRLTCETLSGTLLVHGAGQHLEVSGFLIMASYDGVVCDGVGLDISDSTIVAQGSDFRVMNGGYIHIRRCSHSLRGEVVGGSGAEIKELKMIRVASVAWQDGTPIESGPLTFVGVLDLVLGSYECGGHTAIEVTTWWLTDDFRVRPWNATARYDQVNVSFHSTPLDLLGSEVWDIVLIDDFTPIVGVLHPRPGVLVGGIVVSVVGDYMEFGAGLGTIEVRFDAGPWALADATTDDEWNLTVDELPDGQHTLDVRITDRVGNSRTLSIANVSTDTSSPVIRVIQPPPWVNHDRIRLVARTEVGARAYVGTTEVEVDPLGYFERSFQLEDGSNEFRLMAIDRAGNSFAMVYVVVYDVRPPTVVVERPIDGSWLSTATVIVSGWAEETANVTVNGAAAVRAATAFSVELPAEEGTIDVRIVAMDLALNTCVVGLRVHVDRTPPVIVVETPPVDDRMAETPILVSGSVHELGPVTVTVQGVRAALGGDSWSTWVELDDGWNDIAVVATDAAGNQAKAARRVLLEKPAPTVHATLVVGNAVVWDGKTAIETGEPTAKLTVQVDQPCLLRVTSRAVEMVGPGEVVVELDLRGGRNEIVVNVTDLMGRRGTVIRFVVDRDVLPPAIAITGPDRYSLTQRAQATVWGVTEPGAYVSINGTVVRTGPSGSFSIDVPLIEGVNEVVVVATDGYGNAANVTLTVFRATPLPAPVDEEGPWKLATGVVSGAAFLVMLVMLVRVIGDVRRAPRVGRAAGRAPRTEGPRPPTDAYRGPRVRRRQGP